jgi:quercetin dioxygenase-like cupin family protein
MATKGTTIYNKIVGEKFTWLQTSKDTNGQRIVIDFELNSGGSLPVRHVHPDQEETFLLKKGSFKIELNGTTIVMKEGEKIVIPKGQPHQWWTNSDTEPAYLEVSFEPALNTEEFFEQWFGLYNDGKAKNGIPNFLQIMAMGNLYQIYLASPPIFVQKIMSFVIGGFAKLIGYKATNPKYNEEFSVSS